MKRPSLWRSFFISLNAVIKLLVVCENCEFLTGSFGGASNITFHHKWLAGVFNIIELVIILGLKIILF